MRKALIPRLWPEAQSAIYELVEWWVSVATGEAADAFLGTQGYTWDAQSDMLMCGVGSVAGLLLLSRLSDRAISRLPGAAAAPATSPPEPSERTP